MFNDFTPIDPNLVQPYVYEDERTLAMHFDMGSTQSRMRLADPGALEVDYTRTMMGFLLVEPEPASLLMVGLGGGSIAKYVYKHLPGCDITAVEINPHVIAMRDTFLVPPDDHRFRVVRADGADFVRQARRRYAVVMVDGFTYDGQPETLCTPGFYADCRKSLAPGGLLVVNLHAEEPACSTLLVRVAAAFADDVVTSPSEAGDNRIVFAGRSADFGRCKRDFAQRWDALPAVHRRTLRLSAVRIARGLQGVVTTGLGVAG